MKITVIHGSSRRKGNTRETASIFEKYLREQSQEITFTHFHLADDFNRFCSGCYTCYLKTELKCPHRKELEPILDSMLDSDGIVFTTPVYVMGASAHMKAFLDHLGWLYIPHRPDTRMFTKSTMILSTTAGAGTKHAAGTIRRSLKYWGIPSIRTRGFTLYDLDIDNLRESKKAAIHRKLKKDAALFLRSLDKKRRINLFRWAVTLFMKRIVKTYPDENLDKKYWTELGWL